MTVDELQVLITANTDELRKEINKANKKISNLSKSAAKSSGGVLTAFKKLKTGIVALGIGKVISTAISDGMDAIESDSLFTTVMGDNADAVKSWSNDVADALGLSAVNMQKNIGVIYNMTNSMGVAEENALKMSKGVSVLAEDMASFYNLDSDEAFNKLRAGLTGETEPLKALGILVDENTVKQYAYSEGIAETGAELTNEQKVLARYVAILKQTGNAQGDLARTIDSPSNQLRQLKQQVTNLGIELSSFFMPVVKVALQYLSAFAKVAKNALNSIKPLADKLSAFLGVSSSSASDETQTISDNVDSVSSGLDDATTSAKKLKNSLAGFDEMNVLQDNSSDSSSTSSGGTTTVGLDFDLSEYDAHLDLLDGQTNTLVEKIQGMFASIGEGINFNNLINSFNNLKKSIEPITSRIWDGLGWAFENLLKPLAQWTINDFLPAFLDATSGVLKVLNPILESFKKLGAWLWDSFLQPIAKWTGGVIVSVLDGVAKGLSTLGNWMSKHQGVVDAMVIALTSFFGLWKLTELMAFISMSGGLTQAFSKITSVIAACTTAKIKDIAETVYLTALYAKDFIMGIVSSIKNIALQTKAWLANTIAKATANGTTIAGTVALIAQEIALKAVAAAQWLWNAAMEANPIILLVTAIAALIVGIVALVAHLATEEDAILSTAEAQEILTEAKKAAAEAENSYIDAVDNADEALKRLEEAEKAAGITGDELYKQVQDGTLDYADMTDAQKELYKAYSDNEEKQKELKTATEELSDAKKAETLASLDNQLAIAAETGNYKDYKEAVIKAYKNGKLSADEARDAIEKSMSRMSDASQETFVEDLPNDIKNGLNPDKYQTTGQKIGNWFGSLWVDIKNVFSPVGTWFKNKFDSAVTGIKNAFSSVGSFFSNIWTNIKNAFSTVKIWFSNIFTDAWNGIKNAFSSVTSFFSNIWTNIKNTFSNVGSTIANAVSGTVKKAINAVLSTAVNIINGFISAINFAIGIINKIPGVEINKLTKLEVPKMARGGIVDSPTIAMVGEAGKEAVMPLERNTGWIDQLAVKIGEKIGGATGNIKLTVKLGEEAIFDRFIEYGKEKAFETNGEVVFI